MPVLPHDVENELVERLHKILRSGKERSAYGGECTLPDHDARFSYKFDYQEYHRMGDVQHGIEVTFEITDGDHLVDADINGLENELTRILQSTLSFENEVTLEEEPDRYVFIEEIMHAFGERT